MNKDSKVNKDELIEYLRKVLSNIGYNTITTESDCFICKIANARCQDALDFIEDYQKKMS